jgi:hypothetical protein
VLPLESKSQPIINAAASQRMAKCGVGLVLPSYLPNGYRMSIFRERPYREHCYEAIYSGPNGCEFVISGGTGGWGSPGTIRSWAIYTNAIGRVILEEVDGSRLIPPQSNTLLAMPTPTSNQSVIREFPRAGYILNFQCKSSLFHPASAQRIIRGLKIQR